MINFLQGKAINIDEKSITLLTSSGVGYEVFLNINDLLIIKENQVIDLFVYSHIKEDQFSLFGFTNKNDKKVFEKLISVSGVGPKTGLNAISVTNVNNIIRAIEAKNPELFPKVPGLGKKTIEKIILELNGKFENYLNNIEIEVSPSLKDARLALEALGYNSKEIYNATSEVQEDLDMNTIIKNSLKILSKNK